MSTGKHDLILRNVTFGYGPHAEPVLRDLTLTVPEGDHLAIVGPSGIGKSTLANLLCGLLRPGSGTVQFGDEVATELPPERLAGIRTLIPQEAYVFTGTVWENLVYLCPTATPRQVESAVVAIGAESLIDKLGGLDAGLSRDDLSAGERQLIALVRAYISPAPVVVLDEATCHLDPTAERRAEEAFANRGGTLIVIAHRISSALRARRILVLDGASMAVGDHLTLLATSPLYRELLGHWQGGGASTPAGDGQALAATAHPVEVRLKRGYVPPHVPDRDRNGTATGDHMVQDLEPLGAPNPVTRPAGSGGAGGRWMRRFRRSRRSAPEPTEPAGTPDAGPAGTETGTAGSGTAGTGTAETDAAGTQAGFGQQHRPVIFGRVCADIDVPVAGATLTLTDLSGTQLDRDLADAEGHYRLHPPTGGSYLVICASATHQPTAAVVAVADVPVRHDVVLSSAGAHLSGTVSAADTGHPLADAVVTLINLRGDVVGVASTEPDGRYALLGVAQGHYTLTVAASGLQPVAEGIEVPSAGHLVHDVAMPIRVQLTGVVRTATAGTPVPEALTTLIAADGQVVASALTDSAGGFVFDDLAAGSYTLIASGYPPVAAEVRLDGGAPAETVITLRPPTVETVGRSEPEGRNGVVHASRQEAVEHGEQ